MTPTVDDAVASRVTPNQVDASRAVVAVAAVGLAVAACGLNALFYRQFGPFYDSMSYTNRLAFAIHELSTRGLSGFPRLFDNTTVALPWLLVTPIAGLVTPTRSLAVCLQLPSLLIFAFVLHGYFIRVARMRPLPAAGFAIALITFAAMFDFNGGLSDFRMDLLQCLSFGAAAVFYLTIRKTDGYLPWIGFGVLMGIACLARSTTPVYAAIVFGPIALIDIAADTGRARRIALYAVALASCAIVAGWFYAVNFAYLKYYYLEWNADAVARLPLGKSIAHLRMPFTRHLGVPHLVFLISALVVAIHGARLARRQGEASQTFNWRAMWAGFAPLAYLAVSGAGVNPFVSMVAVPGLLMFFVAPFEGPSGFSRRHEGRLAAAGIGVAAIALLVGLAHHSFRVPSWLPSRAGLTALTDRIEADAGSRAVTFQTMYEGAVASPTVINSLIYDRSGFVLESDNCARKAGLKICFVNGNYSQPAEWASIAGATDDEKLATVRDLALRDIDYLIIPEPDAVLNPLPPINPFAGALREALLASGQLVALGAPIGLSATDRVSVFRNRRAAP